MLQQQQQPADGAQTTTSGEILEASDASEGSEDGSYSHFENTGTGTGSSLERLMKRIIDAKVEVVLLRKKRRVLLEEIHRQYLEGECEPKKRIKTYNDVVKKKKTSAVPTPAVKEDNQAVN